MKRVLSFHFEGSTTIDIYKVGSTYYMFLISAFVKFDFKKWITELRKNNKLLFIWTDYNTFGYDFLVLNKRGDVK